MIPQDTVAEQFLPQKEYSAFPPSLLLLFVCDGKQIFLASDAVQRGMAQVGIGLFLRSAVLVRDSIVVCFPWQHRPPVNFKFGSEAQCVLACRELKPSKPPTSVRSSSVAAG